MQFDYSNKVVFLTGSTGGIGISIAKKFNEFGATLICSGTNKEKLDNLKNLIGSNHYFYKIDLDDSIELDSKIDEIILNHSKIDILINNAGLNSDNLSSTSTISFEPTKLNLSDKILALSFSLIWIFLEDRTGPVSRPSSIFIMQTPVSSSPSIIAL